MFLMVMIMMMVGDIGDMFNVSLLRVYFSLGICNGALC